MNSTGETEVPVFDAKPQRVERPEPSENARFKTPWVPFPEGVKALQLMRTLIGRPDEGRPLNFALIGDPNFGKSHLVDFFVDHYPEIKYDRGARLQIVRVDMPAKADGPALVREILRTMGAPYVRKEPLDEMIAKITVRARLLGVLMFVIDEFNNGHWGRRDAANTLLHTVRSIGNRTQRPFVLAGTPDVENVLRNDAQLNERCIRQSLPLMETQQSMLDLLKTFEARLARPLCPDLDEEKRAQLVWDIAGSKLGRIAILLRQAEAHAAAKGKSSIGAEDLRAAQALLPGSHTR